VKAKTQFKRLKKGGYDLSYKWQMQGHLWVGNAQWCDFVQYSGKMPEGKQLYIYTVKRDEVMISQLRERMKLFRKEVQMNVKILE
jgi:hypothetical protein